MAGSREGASAPFTDAAHKAKIDAARSRGLASLANRYIQRDANRHNYEPGEIAHPMQTDPRCRACGEPKGAAIHD